MEKEIIVLLEEIKKIQKDNEKLNNEVEIIKRENDQEKKDIINKLKDYYSHKIIRDFLAICLKERFRLDDKIIELKKHYIEMKGILLDADYYEITRPIEKNIYNIYFRNYAISNYVDYYFTNMIKKMNPASYEINNDLEKSAWYEDDCRSAGENKYKETVREALTIYRKNENEKIESFLSQDMMMALIKYCGYQNKIIYIENNNYIIDEKKVSDIALEYNIIINFKKNELTITKESLDKLFAYINTYDEAFTKAKK